MSCKMTCESCFRASELQDAIFIIIIRNYSLMKEWQWRGVPRLRNTLSQREYVNNKKLSWETCRASSLIGINFERENIDARWECERSAVYSGLKLPWQAFFSYWSFIFLSSHDFIPWRERERERERSWCRAREDPLKPSL